MYHVISTGIIVTILYLICHLFSKEGFFSISDNRKIWNILLGITFLITAASGLILAIRVNYKLKNPIFDSILKWHVETGIAFSFVALIHLFNHLRYFKDLFKGTISPSVTESEVTREVLQPKLLKANLFLTGFISSSAQLLLMREMLNISGGYELIAGTYLASWLIDSAAGSFFAGRSKPLPLKKLQWLLAISPLFSVILMIVINRFYFNPGETPSFLAGILFNLVVLFPVCFCSGFAFIKMLMAARKQKIFDSGKSYSIETLGGIIAGITITIFTSGILDTYQILFVTIILYIIFIFLTDYQIKKVTGSILITAGVLLMLYTISFPPDKFFRQMLLPGIKVESSKDTPYGNITIGSYGGEKFTCYNHRIARWSYDETEREENIHYAMLQHDAPKKVLLVSGDPVSNIMEIKKYKPEKIYFVERDPELIKLTDKDILQKNEEVEIINDDAFRFIKNSKEKFDVVVMVIPPPSTLLLNRYYTKEFFEEIHSLLGDKGVFSCSPGPSENYYNDQLAMLYSVIFNTMGKVFKNVVPIAGNKLYFIASDREISTNICSLVNKKGIENIYVNENYLNDEIISMKTREILSVISQQSKINTLSSPVACYHYQTYTLTKDLGKIIPAIIILTLLFIFPIFTVRPGNLPIYAASASLAGYEILTLMAIQSTAGNIYHITGLVFAVIMGGLSAGALIKISAEYKTQLRIVMISLLVFYLSAYYLFNRIPSIDFQPIIILVFLTMSFLPSLMTGYLFKLISERGEKESIPAIVYSSDLAGSALGFIVISGIALPFLGSEVTLLILGLLIFIGLIFASFAHR
ncbi:MAG TPA: hypothetical protein PK910_01740 [Bacteroidales bacterium]|nr:hypothetical protein [Bacteroidales bacterium]HRC88730.1 hypothetical protein [Bacteroidales bacterium]